MSKKRSVDTHFWNDTYISNLEPDNKLVFLYLITCPLSNMLGVYEIQKRRISFDTGLSLERIEECFGRLKKDKKADYQDGFVILTNFVSNQSYNTNMIKSAINDLDIIPVSVFKNELFKKIHLSLERVSKGKVTLPNIEVEYESELEDESESESEMIPPPSLGGKNDLDTKADIPKRKEWDEYLLASLRYSKEFTEHLWDHLMVKGWKKGDDPILDWRAYARNQKQWDYEFNQKLKQQQGKTYDGNNRKQSRIERDIEFINEISGN